MHQLVIARFVSGVIYDLSYLPLVSIRLQASTSRCLIIIIIIIIWDKH